MGDICHSQECYLAVLFGLGTSAHYLDTIGLGHMLCHKIVGVITITVAREGVIIIKMMRIRFVFGKRCQ